MWGYRLSIFYSDKHRSPAAPNDLSDWMGVEYAFLDSEDEASDKFDEAWDLLNAYVSGGGSLFMDTGRQYLIPEWEF